MRPAAVLVLPLVVASPLVLVAGCGSPPGTKPADYAHRVCGAVAAFEGSLASQAAAYQKQVTAAKGQPSALVDAAVAFLGQQVTGSTTLLAAVRAVPAPAGRGGDQVAAALVGSAQQAVTAFTGERATVAAARGSDRTALFGVLDGAQKQVAAAGEAIERGLESVAELGDSALNGAFRTDQTCSSL